MTGEINGGTGGSCTCSSDARLKNNIQPLAEAAAIDRLLRLKGVTFEWKNPADHQNHTGEQTGVIAQDVKEVFPDWVGEDAKGFMTVNPDPRTMVALTVESLRAMKDRSDRAESKLSVEARLNAIEAGRSKTLAWSVGGQGGIVLALGVAVGAIAIFSSRRKKEEKS